jgi:hypothetical protein
MLVAFAILYWPLIQPGVIPGPDPDAADYAHLAQSLLHGSFVVDYDGPPRVPRYTPGFSVLLAPAVALGGVESSVWIGFLSALALGGLVLLLSYRAGGPLAPPLAVFMVMFPPVVRAMTQVVMSDLPSAMLVVTELTLLTLGSEAGIVAAGMIAGATVWIRPSMLVLLIAGLVAVGFTSNGRARGLKFLAAAFPSVLALALWQWLMFGKPWTVSYQAAGASGDGRSGLEAFFDIAYVYGPPWNAYGVGPDSNLVAYAQILIGMGEGIIFPGVAVVGAVAAIVMFRWQGPSGMISRYTLAATVLTLGLYLPYFFRDQRFLIVPTCLLSLTASIAYGRLVLRVRELSSLPSRLRGEQ